MEAEKRVQVVVAVAACSFAIIVGGAMCWKMYQALTLDTAQALIKDHFLVAVFLPLSTMAALLIVMIFRSASGPVEFEALGFKFKGAAGETVMWIACFLAIAAAAKMLY